MNHLRQRGGSERAGIMRRPERLLPLQRTTASRRRTLLRNAAKRDSRWSSPRLAKAHSEAVWGCGMSIVSDGCGPVSYDRGFAMMAPKVGRSAQHRPDTRRSTQPLTIAPQCRTEAFRSRSRRISFGDRHAAFRATACPSRLSGVVQPVPSSDVVNDRGDRRSA